MPRFVLVCLLWEHTAQAVRQWSQPFTDALGNSVLASSKLQATASSAFRVNADHCGGNSLGPRACWRAPWAACWLWAGRVSLCSRY